MERTEDQFGEIEEQAQGTPEVEAPAQQPETPVEEQPAETVDTPKPTPEPGYAPIAALLDERDKRKALEVKLAQFEQPKEEPKIPDIFEDPEGRLRVEREQFQRELYQTKYTFSDFHARQTHGAETVDKAIEWARERTYKDPHFNQAALSSADPVGFAVEQYQRDQIVSTVKPDEFKAFQEWQAAQAQQQQQPLAAVQPEIQSPAIPKSLATASSAGAPTLPKADPIAEKLDDMFGG